jgi:hypothetical protein
VLNQDRIIMMDTGSISNPSILFIPTNLMGVFQTSMVMHARSSTNSWGGYTTAYDNFAFQFDAFAKSNPDYLSFAASGNNCRAGIRSTPGGFAKNIISVGAADANGALASFTCQWPSTLVPLIIINGVSIASAQASLNSGIHLGFIEMSGTSMATPFIARLRSVVEQRVCNVTQRVSASSFMIRSAMVANTIPPARLFRFQNEFFNNSAKWFFGDFLQTSTGGMYRKCFYFNTSASFKAVLSWLDDPGARLYNDLDLMITYDDQWFWGNGGQQSDTLNTNEIVNINIPTGGKVVRVTVNDYGLQEQFALTITSSAPLMEVDCNQTCSKFDAPLECDYGAFGTGYHLCNIKGYEMHKCTFHSCDEHYVFQNRSCVRHSNNKKSIRNKNGYYYEDELLQGCEERCYLPDNATECVCIVPLLTPAPSPPPSQLLRSSSSSSSFSFLVLFLFLFLLQ